MSKPYIINAELQPKAANPHSWLVLHGNEPGALGPRIMTGTLRPLYRGFSASAAAFGKAKVQPVPSADGNSWTVTAARVEVLLPQGADDLYVDPRTLMEEADALATGPTDPLLAYITLSWTPDRLHHMYEEVRQFLREEVVVLGCPVLLVQHAPHLARNRNLPHCHAMAVPVRLSQLGWCERIGRLTGDKARTLILRRFAAFQDRQTARVAAS